MARLRQAKGLLGLISGSIQVGVVDGVAGVVPSQWKFHNKH